MFSVSFGFDDNQQTAIFDENMDTELTVEKLDEMWDPSQPDETFEPDCNEFGYLVDPTQWILGYGRLGNATKLLIRSSSDPEFGRMYTYENLKREMHQTYCCPCKKPAVLVNENSEVCVRKRIEDHSCPEIPFRVMFFELKKHTMVYGQPEEIEYFEQATHIENHDHEHTPLEQRNWTFVYSDEIERESLLIIREPKRRLYAREYVVGPTADGDEELTYICKGCDPDSAAQVFVHHMPLGVHVICEKPNQVHSAGCEATLVTELSEKHNFNIVDYLDLDIFEIIPDDRWTFGYCAAGHKNSRLIIREKSDPTICREYGVVNAKIVNKKKTIFMCTVCRCRVFYAYYIPGEPARIVAPCVDHDKCEPKNYVACMHRQKQFDVLTEVSKQFTGAENDDQGIDAYLKMPRLPSWRTIFNPKSTELYITCDADPHLGYKFDKVDVDLGMMSDKAFFKCINDKCQSVALLWTDLRRKYVRNDANHVETCVRYPVDPPKFRDVAEPDISIIASTMPKETPFRVVTKRPNLQTRTERNYPTPVSINKAAFNADVPLVPYQRVQMNKQRTKMFIKRDDKTDLGYKFDLAADNPSNRRDVKLMSCTHCNAVAILRAHSLNRITVRHDFKHDSTCKPVCLTSADEEMVSIEDMKKAAQKRNHPEMEEVEVQQKKREKIQTPMRYPPRPKVHIPAKFQNPPVAQTLPTKTQTIVIKRVLPRETRVEGPSFVRPSNTWLKNSPFGPSSTQAAYKVWGSLQEVDLSLQELSVTDNIKEFASGFALVAYLFTGSECNAAIVKEILGKYFLINHKSLGVVDSIDCSNLDGASVGEIMYADDMIAYHFASLAKMAGCTVYVYDVQSKRCQYGKPNDETPTVVVGLDDGTYFLWID